MPTHLHANTLHAPTCQKLRRAGDAEQDLILKVPRSFSELRAVRHTLGLYQEQCPAHVAILLLATYLFMQVLPLSSSCTARGARFRSLNVDFLHRLSCRVMLERLQDLTVRPAVL